jgi:hypothetical protein
LDESAAAFVDPMRIMPLSFTIAPEKAQFPLKGGVLVVRPTRDASESGESASIELQIRYQVILRPLFRRDIYRDKSAEIQTVAIVGTGVIGAS